MRGAFMVTAVAAVRARRIDGRSARKASSRPVGILSLTCPYRPQNDAAEARAKFRNHRACCLGAALCQHAVKTEKIAQKFRIKIKELVARPKRFELLTPTLRGRPCHLCDNSYYCGGSFPRLVALAINLRRPLPNDLVACAHTFRPTPANERGRQLRQPIWEEKLWNGLTRKHR